MEYSTIVSSNSSNTSLIAKTSSLAKLQIWNQYYADKFLPASVFMLIMIILGVFGNMIVLSVYIVRPPLRTSGRYFIPYLAVTDISSTVFGASLGLMKYFRYVSSPGDAICKILTYFTYTSVFASLFLLLIIAVQRYIKVCRPFGHQLSIMECNVLILLSAVVPGCFLIPLTAWNGTFAVTNNEIGVEGTQCGFVPEYLDRATVYRKICGLIPFLEICLMSTIYYKIWRYMPSTQHNRTKKKTDNHPTNESIGISHLTPTIVSSSGKDRGEVMLAEGKIISTEEAPGHKQLVDDDIHAEAATLFQSRNCKAVKASERASESRNTELYSASEDVQDDHESDANNDTNIHTIRHQKGCACHPRGGQFSRTTVIFILISVISFMSYIPSAIVVSIEMEYQLFFENLSPKIFILISVVRVLYLFNHSANPLIYGIFDTKFRHEMQILVRSVLNKT